MSARQSQKTRAAVWVVMTMMIGLIAIVSCKSDHSNRATRALTLGLSWVHQAQFSGPYYADRHGLYAKEGLRVTFVPASIDSDPLDGLIDDKYDFVIAQPGTLIAARLKGHRFKAVAATYRIHPLVFLSLEGSGIDKPQDFRGKTIGVAYAERLILMALLRKVHIDPSEVEVVNRSSYDLGSLQRGDVDVQVGWVTNELQTARRKGLALNVISPHDYGITFYADVLTVRESFIEKEPALVEKFVRATMRGWAEALQDPEESAKLSRHYDAKLDPVHEARVLRATGPLVHTGVDRIGWMQREDWEEMMEALHEEGVIAERPDVDDLYTTRFLEAHQQQ